MIGDNIKRIRELKGLGLNELARMADINASYLSAIEQNKKTNPSVKTLEKLAKALGVLSEELFRTELMYAEEIQNNGVVYEPTALYNTIPNRFTNSHEAREYIEMHKILVSEGFNLKDMLDEDVLDFANEILKQMKLISYKYKK